MTITQNIALEPQDYIEIGPISAAGNPSVVETSFKLNEMPEGDWHLRALTTSEVVELPAQAFELNPDTLEIKASFANWVDADLTIIGFTVAIT